MPDDPLIDEIPPSDDVVGASIAAMAFAQIALVELMNSNPDAREKIIAVVEQLISQHVAGGTGNRAAAKLMQNWLDLNTKSSLG
jgi:hypothetical protein